ncbi:MAG: hypothetical protein ACRDRK_06820, partial [Pseudonocardia sp.]
ADLSSVAELTQQLVRIPTRGGIDPYDDAIDTIAGWATDHGLSARRLIDEASGRPVAVVCDVETARPGPRYVLDACLDTAPFGDPARWTNSPTSGLIEDGWMHGRGTADSAVSSGECTTSLTWDPREDSPRPIRAGQGLARCAS